MSTVRTKTSLHFPVRLDGNGAPVRIRIGRYYPEDMREIAELLEAKIATPTAERKFPLVVPFVPPAGLSLFMEEAPGLLRMLLQEDSKSGNRYLNVVTMSQLLEYMSENAWRLTGVKGAISTFDKSVTSYRIPNGPLVPIGPNGGIASGGLSLELIMKIFAAGTAGVPESWMRQHGTTNGIKVRMTYSNSYLHPQNYRLFYARMPDRTHCAFMVRTDEAGAAMRFAIEQKTGQKIRLGEYAPEPRSQNVYKPTKPRPR